VHAVAGIGNPQRFFDLLTKAGVIVTPHSLPDHAPLRPADLKFGDNSPVLITEKDAVKCESFAADNVWCVVVAMEFENDHGDRLMQRVMEIL
jgi:tetraacyldisaccharide 4'-kinase